MNPEKNISSFLQLSEALCGSRSMQGYGDKMFDFLKNIKIGEGHKSEEIMNFLFRLIIQIQEDLEANKVHDAS